MNTPDHGHLSPDMLEEAARGLLPPDRMAEIDAHCAVCDACRDALADERLIAEGTRSWARAALKRRLAGAVAHERQNAVPWPRILTAAAVVLAVAGTGIVYRWLSTGPDTPPVAMKAASHDTTMALADRAEEQTTLEGYAAPTAAAPARLQEEARKKQAPEGPPLGYASAEAERKEETAAPAPVARVDAGETADALMKSGTETLVLWGTPLEMNADKKDKAVVSQAQQTQQTQVFRNGMGSGGQGVIIPAAPRPSSSAYRVSQQNAPGMVRRDLRARTDEVPASVAWVNDTLHIVLMPDPPLPADDIRFATVRTFPPDSFQVVLPGRVLGFKAPQALFPDHARGRR